VYIWDLGYLIRSPQAIPWRKWFSCKHGNPSLFFDILWVYLHFVFQLWLICGFKFCTCPYVWNKQHVDFHICDFWIYQLFLVDAFFDALLYISMYSVITDGLSAFHLFFLWQHCSQDSSYKQFNSWWCNSDIKLTFWKLLAEQTFVYHWTHLENQFSYLWSHVSLFCRNWHSKQLCPWSKLYTLTNRREVPNAMCVVKQSTIFWFSNVHCNLLQSCVLWRVSFQAQSFSAAMPLPAWRPVADHHASPDFLFGKLCLLDFLVKPKTWMHV
jgi:hypothetical protein